MTILNPLAGLMSDFAMELASGVANLSRQKTFNQTARPPYAGPRVLAQGDSWFCYPHEALPFDAPKDCIWRLGQEFAVSDMAVPGARTWQYVDTARFEAVLDQLDALKIDVLLLSGGGNDLVRDRNLTRILPSGDRPVEQYLGRAFRDVVQASAGNLARLASAALRRRPGLKIVFSAYGYAFPTPRGVWFGEPMTAIGIPAAKQKLIADKMLERYAAALADMARRLDAGFGDGTPTVVVANTLDAVPNRKDWFDELHPTTEGFTAVAAELRKAILKVHPLVS
jgi:lysophospholipase L1-like esterase